MAIARGHKSYIQIGPESQTAWGTAVAATSKLEVINMNISPQTAAIPDPSLYDAVSHRDIYQGGVVYPGSITTRVNYQGEAFLELLRGLLPTYTSPATPAALGSLDHTFKEGSDLFSYTVEMGEGDIPAGTVQEAWGTKVTGATIRGTAGTGADAMLQAEFGTLSKTKSDSQAPTGSLNFPTTNPVLYHHGNVWDDGTGDAQADIRLRSFELSIENALHDDRYYIGSLNIDEPIRSDFMVVQARFTQEFKTITALQAHKNWTSGTPRLLFKAGTLPGSEQYEFDMTLHDAKLIEYSVPVDNYGILIASSTWQAYYNAANSTAITLRVRSDDSALSAVPA